MSKICPLFSGSTGNSTYIGTKNGGILIDAGASMKGICSALERAGGTLDDIQAIAVTHTHSDHIKGLTTILKRTDIQLIATEETLKALQGMDKIPSGTKVMAIGESPVDICGIELNGFATSHDCQGSCGYTAILPDGKKVSVCTDLGVVTDSVRSAIMGSDVVLLESNHDIDMLKSGPYTPALKLRILSDSGHISNIACSAELKGLLNGGTTRFILGHLSRHNNTPLLAKSCAEAALIDMGAVNGRDCLLSVAAPTDNGVTVV